MPCPGGRRRTRGPPEPGWPGGPAGDMLQAEQTSQQSEYALRAAQGEAGDDDKLQDQDEDAQGVVAGLGPASGYKSPKPGDQVFFCVGARSVLGGSGGCARS